MGKENQVEIKGHRYRYKYNKETGKTDYIGPVGDAPPISEEKFLEVLFATKDAEECLDNFEFKRLNKAVVEVGDIVDLMDQVSLRKNQHRARDDIGAIAYLLYSSWQNTQLSGTKTESKMLEEIMRDVINFRNRFDAHMDDPKWWNWPEDTTRTMGPLRKRIEQEILPILQQRRVEALQECLNKL